MFSPLQTPSLSGLEPSPVAQHFEAVEVQKINCLKHFTQLSYFKLFFFGQNQPFKSWEIFWKCPVGQPPDLYKVSKVLQKMIWSLILYLCLELSVSIGTWTSSRETRWEGSKPEEKGTNPPVRSLSNIFRSSLVHLFLQKLSEMLLLDNNISSLF